MMSLTYCLLPLSFCIRKARYRYESLSATAGRLFLCTFPSMSLRRNLLRVAYPAYRLLSSFTQKGAVAINHARITPPASFCTLTAPLNVGSLLNFESFKGKKILIVNTASDCVYTSQYAELENLYQQFKEKLVVMAFPSNDFGGQEKGSDEEIATYCTGKYHVSFPIAAKSHVTGDRCNMVFSWLASSELNGWNDQAPVWNFSKYLVDEGGVLTHYFGPAVTVAKIKKLAFRAG